MTTCPECGAEFPPHSHRGPPRQFCTPAHKRAFFHLMDRRGAVLAPLAIVWRANRRGTTETTKYARAMMSALIDQWTREDRAAGRNSALIVERKMAAHWSAADLA